MKRLVDGSLAASGGIARQLLERVEPTAGSGRLSIRLRSDDLLLLRERAAGRDMPTSTYASLLIRANLRTLTPLPTAELAALRRSVAKVGAIGRNLNQIARGVNRGEAPTGPSPADLRALLGALTGLRDHFQSPDYRKS